MKEEMTWKELFDIAVQQFLNGKITTKEFIEVVKMVGRKLKSNPIKEK